MKVSELIEQLKQYDQDSVVAADIWSYDDVRSAADHLENLTDEQCITVLAYLNKNLDSEYGITNDRVIRIVDNLIESGELDYNYTDN